MTGQKLFTITLVLFLTKFSLGQNRCLSVDTTDAFSNVRTATSIGSRIEVVYQNGDPKKSVIGTTTLFFQYNNYMHDQYFLLFEFFNNYIGNYFYKCTLKLDDNSIQTVEYSKQEPEVPISYEKDYFSIYKPLLSNLATKKVKLIRFSTKSGNNVDISLNDEQAEIMLKAANCMLTIQK